jgi:hypothetical protein
MRDPPALVPDRPAAQITLEERRLTAMLQHDWRTRFHQRLDELARDIRRMRDQRSRGTHDRDVGGDEDLAAIEGRHAELQDRFGALGETPPESDVIETLDADFDGLMNSIRDWIQRQDAKAARR